MMDDFYTDPYPGRPRILFIGLAHSSHTHSWIDLLQDAQFNLRLFSTSEDLPPADWNVRTYVTRYAHEPLERRTRAALHSSGRLARFAKRNAARVARVSVPAMTDRWLARIIRSWRPDVVHTLGLESAANYFFRVRRSFGLEGIGKWVLQTRGGSDLALSHLDPEQRPALAEVLRACDQLLSDNEQNFRIAREFGLREDQLSRIGTVPGTGGIEVRKLQERWAGKPSRRGIILWPKVYEVPWSKALPVYEALKLCWDRLPPCELQMLAASGEALMYYWTLPEHIRRHCVVRDRISRAEALEVMTRARVMLAPSLVDGTPNSMFEAMAAGALPIVSPLETIRAIVEPESNVLFARNLYPHEIADALVRAMTDDQLVDTAAEANLDLVSKLADREKIRPRVVGFYEDLSRHSTRAGSNNR